MILIIGAGVVGDGRSVAVLREADIDRAEIVVASTDSDAANVMACNAAEQVGEPHTIARVKDVGLYRTWQSLEGGLGVDTMLCLDRLAAEAVVRTLTLPGARAVDTFADGRVEVAEFEIGDETPVTDQRIADADRYPSVTFAAILRDDEIIIPDGDTVIRAGDCVVVIGGLHGVRQFAESIASTATLDIDDDVVIVGGETIGYQIAQQFEARGLAPRIVEPDADRAARLADRFPGASVAETDVASGGRFDPDYLTGADLVVGTVDDDTNYLLARLAQDRDVDRTAAVVDDPAVVDIFERSDLDIVVHPQDIVAGEILQSVYGSGPEDIGILEHDDAEVLEVAVDDGSDLTGRTLRDAAAQLPAGFVIGAIIRDGQLQTPRGNRIVQTGDRIIAFVDADAAAEIAERL